MSSAMETAQLEIQQVTCPTISPNGICTSICHLKSDNIEHHSSIRINDFSCPDQIQQRSKSPRPVKKLTSHWGLKRLQRRSSTTEPTGTLPSSFIEKHSTMSHDANKSFRIDQKTKGSAGLSQKDKPGTSISLLHHLPLEIQYLIIKELPYRSLLALRLVSHHFPDRLLPLPILTTFRRQLSRDYIATERATLNTILKVPGVRSRFNRFWYQDPFYMSYLIWKLEQGGTTEALACFKSMEYLRCYTCLELKGAFTGEFSRKFSTRSRGLGGTRADTRMCKECMVRKTIHGLYGRWWKEGYWRERDIVRVRKHSGTLSAHKIKDSISEKADTAKPQFNKEEEHGVCAACRRECYSLYWGCAACFNKEQTRLQELDLHNCTSKRTEKRYKFSVRKAELKHRWYTYSGMSGLLNVRYSVDSSFSIVRCCSQVLGLFHPHRMKDVRNLIGGKDYWLYRDWKKRMKRYEVEDAATEGERESAPALLEDPSSYTGARDFTAWCIFQHEQSMNATDKPSNNIAEMTNKHQPCNADHPSQVWTPYTTHTETCPAPSTATWSKPTSSCTWEIRCSECWRYNRPNHWYVSAIYDQLPYDRLCTPCQDAISSGKARRAKRDEWKKKQNRQFVVYGDSSTRDVNAALYDAGDDVTTSISTSKETTSGLQDVAEVGNTSTLPPPVMDAVANAVAWQTISRIFAESGYD